MKDEMPGPTLLPADDATAGAQLPASLEARIRALATDAEQLEMLYERARGEGDERAFGEAMAALAAEQPGNLVFAAWQARLRRVGRAAARAVHWRWAIPLAVASGLSCYALSSDRWWVLLDKAREVPLLLLVAGPVSACFVMLYVCLAGVRDWRRLGLSVAGLLALTAYGVWIQPRLAPRVFERQYLQLLALHLLILAWCAIGLYVLRRPRDAEDRFALLSRSLEIVAIAMLLAAMGGAFAGVTYALFGALGLELEGAMTRLLSAGVGGAIVVVAVALGYDPRRELTDQGSGEGVLRLLVLAGRLLLPLTVAVGLAYLPFVALNFRVPFENREVLVIYNIMLVAVIALLVAAVPLRGDIVSRRWAPWLRRGLAAAAALALGVGLYALAAVVYRTALDGWTPNRLAIIGWNIVLVLVLAHLLGRQLRSGSAEWAREVRGSLSLAFLAAGAWALVVVLLPPWLFAQPPQGANDLPAQLRWLVEELPPPILLKCSDRPEVYLLEGGRRRWIRDITTFEEQGFRWNNVQYVSCDDLSAIALGTPIPPHAGRPPALPPATRGGDRAP